MPEAQQLIRELSQQFRNAKSLIAEVAVQIEDLTARGIRPDTMRYVLAFERPDKMAITQKTSFASPTVVCDGKHLYVFQPATMAYREQSVTGSLDWKDEQDIIDAGHGLGAVMHWMLQANPYEAILQHTVEAYYVGQDMTGGVKTQQVQLIQMGWNVDIWIRMDKPLIHKICFTRQENEMWAVQVGGFLLETPWILRRERRSGRLVLPTGASPVGSGAVGSTKAVLADLPDRVIGRNPDITATFGNWVIDADVPESLFQFKPPPGAKKAITDGPTAAPGRWNLPQVATRPAGNDEHKTSESGNLQGQPVPPATMKMIGGGTFAPAKLKGKILVLGFWSSETASSEPLLQAMIEIATQYGSSRGVQVCAINVGESAPKARGYLARRDWHLSVAVDPDGDALKQYRIQALPGVVVADRRGIVQTPYLKPGPNLKAELLKAIDAAMITPRQSTTNKNLEHPIP